MRGVGPATAIDVVTTIVLARYTVVSAPGAEIVLGTPIFRTPSLAANSSATFTITLKAGSTTGLGAVVPSTVSQTTDPNPFNNYVISPLSTT